ncbi:MAG TPA: hypothetical protein VNJ08_00865 [Bacteriovoracaceae bacterium]|nr:hypothetical protein [Bacteriovoracaceae bacterium]
MHLIALGLLLACPDLTGKYATCRSTTGNSTGASDLEVSQVIKNGASEYTISSIDSSSHERESLSYRADGKTHVQTETDPDSGTILSLATTVTCVGKELRSKMVLTYGGEIYSTLTTKITREGKTLTQVVKGLNMGENINETIVCD